MAYGDPTDRDHHSRGPSDCPACGRQLRAGAVPAVENYKRMHCQDCAEGIEQRHRGTESDADRDRDRVK